MDGNVHTRWLAKHGQRDGFNLDSVCHEPHGVMRLHFEADDDINRDGLVCPACGEVLIRADRSAAA